MSSASTPKPRSRGREWAPRFWEGCSLPAWIRLLARNRCAVHPSHWYIAAVITGVSTGHSLLRFFEEAFYRHLVARTKITHPPLIILGHWRSGTTLLHELLILDSRHAFPTTYQCLEPNHFLLTETVLSKLLSWLLPGKRPMDNMAAGWGRPQEDEFALCMLGEHSPYLTIAFPNHGPVDQDYLDLDGLSRRDRERWKRSLLTFLKRITLKDPRRLVLKSPTHTARIPTLLELFPEARFVHIVRNPYVIFPSTVNLWKSLYSKHGMQKPTFAGVEEHVFSTFSHMYERFEEGLKLIDPSHFHEVMYEDLVRDPMGQMADLYRQLDLGGFEAVKPRIQQYLDNTKGYETNKYDLTPELRGEIGRRWGGVIRKYGYPIEKD